MDIEIPGYKLLRTLGKGGMATVYLAQQEIFEREVAIKVMSRSLAEDPSFGQRFFREAKIVSQLMHPNIVTVHDAGVHKGSYFLSMEYIDGHDLKYLRKKLSLPQKISVIRDIARALDYAGSKGYVHRDIKPENIMFRGGDGGAVLTDFGIARAVKTDLAVTQTGTAIGTPHYMSPEQAKGKAVDHRSDLYSLGVVFYLLLTGRVPYDAESAVAIGIKHITEPVPQLPGSLSQLQPLLNGLMAKSPDDRYQRGGEFLLDLDEVDVTILKFNPASGDASGVSISEANNTLSDTDLTEAETERFTLVFDTDESLPRGTGSFWSGFFAILFVLVAIATIVYISRPAALESWIENVEEFSQDSYQKIQKLLSDSGDFVKEQVEQVDTAADKLPIPQKEDASNTFAEQSEQKVEFTSAVKEMVSEVETTAANDSLESNENNRDEAGEAGDLLAPDREPTELENKQMLEARVAELEGNIQKLREASKRDNAYVPAWIEAHYLLLAESPYHVETRNSLVSIQESYQQEILKLANAGNGRMVEKNIARFRGLFPDYSARDLSVLEKQAAAKLNIYALLKKGDDEMAKRSLVQPVEANALETFQTVLRLDPQNSVVNIRLAQLSNILTDIAEQQVAAQEWKNAQASVSHALEAKSDNERAIALELEIGRELMHKRELADALSAAAEYRSAGQLYEPLYANAYDQYIKVLSLDSENSIAQTGLIELVDALSAKVWALVGDEKFDEARVKLQRPRLLLADNQRIQALVLAVEEVIVDRAAAPELDGQ